MTLTHKMAYKSMKWTVQYSTIMPFASRRTSGSRSTRMRCSGASLSTGSDMGWESCSIRKIGFTRVSGQMTSAMGEGSKGTAMETNTKVISKMARHMEKESTSGRMEKFMMENGETELRKAMACGEASSETAT